MRPGDHYETCNGCRMGWTEIDASACDCPRPVAIDWLQSRETVREHLRLYFCGLGNPRDAVIDIADAVAWIDPKGAFDDARIEMTASVTIEHLRACNHDCDECDGTGRVDDPNDDDRTMTCPECRGHLRFEEVPKLLVSLRDKRFAKRKVYRDAYLCVACEGENDEHADECAACGIPFIREVQSLESVLRASLDALEKKRELVAAE